MSKSIWTILWTVALALAMATSTYGDPCGMVPPVYTGQGDPIKRVGAQKTYVFYKDGVESFVIRPGFSGKVSEFGMLIPFPSVPSLRKMPDDIFKHITAAIDPPEVVVDLRPRPPVMTRTQRVFESKAGADKLKYKDTVRVIKQEAVGMYEVAVLEAGSAQALKRWMDDHGYRYPEGMDEACNDYVDAGWCFVAVKTRVGQKGGVDPKPGMRKVKSKLPQGATFDGKVQAMGFRFRVKEPVVPMRLSAFNKGKLHNIVYFLTDAPKSINNIPKKYVVRQISGKELYRNVAHPLPLRVIGGTIADIPKRRWKKLKKQRNPRPKNGHALDLFASDLLAVKRGQLAHPYEEKIKVLLRIGERLGLRGDKVDRLHRKALEGDRRDIEKKALHLLKGMTMTVIDGDFPRVVLARENLTFASYEMPDTKNTPAKYHARHKGPFSAKKEGKIYRGPQGTTAGHFDSTWKDLLLYVLLTVLLGGFFFLLLRNPQKGGEKALFLFVAGSAFFLAGVGQVQGAEKDLSQLVKNIEAGENAEEAVNSLVKKGNEALPHLLGLAFEGPSLESRGWAIVGISEIGGEKADKRLAKLHRNGKEPPLVRTWAAAARVRMASDFKKLHGLLPLLNRFPPLERPFKLRALALIQSQEGTPSAEVLLKLTLRNRKLNQVLGGTILKLGPEPLVQAMLTAKSVRIRRRAAAYLASLGRQKKNRQKTAATVARACRFQPGAKKVPWAGGPLFIPSINWPKEQAQNLARDLLAWHIWAEERKKRGIQQQIHNNLRSNRLVRAAGYPHPGWKRRSARWWIFQWGKKYGKGAIRDILKEQDLLGKEKYKKMLQRIR